MAGKYLFTNNATSILRIDTPAASTTITVPTGEGVKFPTPTAPDFAMVTLEDRRSGQLEICKMTARSTDVLAVTRAQEGTTAQSFLAGASVSNRMTAGTLAGIQSSGSFLPIDGSQPMGGNLDMGNHTIINATLDGGTF